MALKETMHEMEHLLSGVSRDLTKVHCGNKSAAQRVRVKTIRLERLAKMFRRESVAAEKGGKLRKPRLRGKRGVRKLRFR